MIWETELKNLDAFARQFWEVVGKKKIFAFHGEMGAGKTTTITALCREKGITDTASSPTFSIINQYQYFEAGNSEKLYHIDLYRLKGEDEVQSAGVEDCVFSGSVCFIEWPEKAPYLFDENAFHVFIRPLSEGRRTIQILTHNEFMLNSFA